MQWIKDILPYGSDFLFVDDILFVDENSIKGTYTFNKNLTFYQHHFIENPVTPGVILTECAAQISLACLGIYLLGKTYDYSNFKFGMSSSNIEYIKPVFPGEKVTVIAEKLYFRFNKLKCTFKMLNENTDVVCSGEIAGMMK